MAWIRLASCAVLLLVPAPASAQPLDAPGQQLVYLICLAVFLIFVGIGAYMLWRAIKERNLAKECLNWPTAGGEVLSSEVEVQKRRANRRNRTAQTIYTYYPRIRYAYEAGGGRHESRSIRFGQVEAGTKGWAEKLVATYPAGATVAVRYNPADPSVAVLETEWSSQRFWHGILFIFFGTVVPLAVMLVFGAVNLQDRNPAANLEQQQIEP